jgi:uncharacterized protein (TIGR00369 family)
LADQPQDQGLQGAPGSPERLTYLRDRFRRSRIFSHLGMELHHLAPGEVHVGLPARPEYQHAGGAHGGYIALVLDTAGFHAAMTLQPEGTRMTTVEFKLNFVAPAIDVDLYGIGRVFKAGRRIILSTVDVLAGGPDGKPVATGITTQMLL